MANHNRKRAKLAQLIVDGEIAWHDGGNGNKNEYVADYLLLHGVTVPLESPKMPPCPFCGEELEHGVELNTYRHPKNNCLLSGRWISQPESIELWKKRAGTEQLQKERDALMAEVAKQHDCHTCVHDLTGLDPCEAVDCNCEECNVKCGCRSCINGSNWEWAGKDGKA